MSTEIIVQAEVRDMAILKDTCTEMGLSFRELTKDVVLSVHGDFYRDIVVNTETGQITYDNSDEGHVTELKKSYSMNLFKEQAIREGNTVEMKVDSLGGEVMCIRRPR